MSTHENELLDELAVTVAGQRSLLRWILGALTALIAGVVAATVWVVRQESAITALQDADRTSVSERTALRSSVEFLRESQHRAAIESTRLSSDIGFIREVVTDIKTKLDRKTTASNP